MVAGWGRLQAYLQQHFEADVKILDTRQTTCKTEQNGDKLSRNSDIILMYTLRKNEFCLPTEAKLTTFLCLHTR